MHPSASPPPPPPPPSKSKPVCVHTHTNIYIYIYIYINAYYYSFFSDCPTFMQKPSLSPNSIGNDICVGYPTQRKLTQRKPPWTQRKQVEYRSCWVHSHWVRGGSRWVCKAFHIPTCWYWQQCKLLAFGSGPNAKPQRKWFRVALE